MQQLYSFFSRVHNLVGLLVERKENLLCTSWVQHQEDLCEDAITSSNLKTTLSSQIFLLGATKVSTTAGGLPYVFGKLVFLDSRKGSLLVAELTAQVDRGASET